MYFKYVFQLLEFQLLHNTEYIPSISYHTILLNEKAFRDDTNTARWL